MVRVSTTTREMFRRIVCCIAEGSKASKKKSTHREEDVLWNSTFLRTCELALRFVFRLKMPGARLELARLIQPKDFKSSASTIPPPGRANHSTVSPQSLMAGWLELFV